MLFTPPSPHYPHCPAPFPYVPLCSITAVGVLSPPLPPHFLSSPHTLAPTLPHTLSYTLPYTLPYTSSYVSSLASTALSSLSPYPSLPSPCGQRLERLDLSNAFLRAGPGDTPTPGDGLERREEGGEPINVDFVGQERTTTHGTPLRMPPHGTAWHTPHGTNRTTHTSILPVHPAAGHFRYVAAATGVNAAMASGGEKKGLWTQTTRPF